MRSDPMTNATQSPARGVEVTQACPFCGSREGLTVGETVCDALVRWWSVECHGCNVSNTANTEAEAIAAWNTRTPPAQPEDGSEVERLREALRQVDAAICDKSYFAALQTARAALRTPPAPAGEGNPDANDMAEADAEVERILAMSDEEVMEGVTPEEIAKMRRDIDRLSRTFAAGRRSGFIAGRDAAAGVCDGCMIADCSMADQIRGIEAQGALHKAMVTAERPREPTEKMVEQASCHLPGVSEDGIRGVWRTMWDMARQYRFDNPPFGRVKGEADDSGRPI
jgi:Lar family restriction alleviation protein